MVVVMVGIIQILKQIQTVFSETEIIPQLKYCCFSKNAG